MLRHSKIVRPGGYLEDLDEDTVDRLKKFLGQAKAWIKLGENKTRIGFDSPKKYKSGGISAGVCGGSHRLGDGCYRAFTGKFGGD